MSDVLTFRSFNNEDYKTIVEWWDWWWGKGKAIERNILPHNDYCYIIEKNNIPVASAFLYIDKNAPIGYLTFLISNPEYKEKDRRLIIEQLIKNIEKQAKLQEIKCMFTICESIHTQNIHNKLGWSVSKVPTYETFKYI
jgi:N-acetylglutamate synthase-like GNAT family acetyltransferase